MIPNLGPFTTSHLTIPKIPNKKPIRFETNTTQHGNHGIGSRNHPESHHKTHPKLNRCIGWKYIPTILFKAVCLAPLPPDRWRVRLQGGTEKVRSLTHLSGFWLFRLGQGSLNFLYRGESNNAKCMAILSDFLIIVHCLAWFHKMSACGCEILGAELTLGDGKTGSFYGSGLAAREFGGA